MPPPTMATCGISAEVSLCAVIGGIILVMNLSNLSILPNTSASLIAVGYAVKGHRTDLVLVMQSITEVSNGSRKWENISNLCDKLPELAVYPRKVGGCVMSIEAARIGENIELCYSYGIRLLSEDGAGLIEC